MKGQHLFFTSLPAIAAGIALIFFHNSISSASLVNTGGILFIATGLINIALLLWPTEREDKSRRGFFSNALGWCVGAASVLLGLAMLIFQDRFMELVYFMLAVLIAISALYQFFLLSIGSRPVKLPAWLFIAPILLTGISVFLFVPSSIATDSVVMLTTGIAFIIFGIAMLIEGVLIGNANRMVAKAYRTQARETAETPVDPAPEGLPQDI